jgi:hypothetical protein
MAVAACLAILQLASAPPAPAAELKATSERTVAGFGHPETVIYDPARKVLYVSDFGPELKPADKDGKGRISKVGLDGRIIEPAFLPKPGQVLNKPKGMWVIGKRLWVTDIDALWIFDLETREGRRLELPGIQFANDVTVMNGAAYVSDNRTDQLYRVHPADFLAARADPAIDVVLSGKSIFPNGIYPAKGGGLLLAGFKSKEEPRGIYRMAPGQDPQPLTEAIGMLDGLVELKDGAVLATDWVSGSLFSWSRGKGIEKLATGFKGPADFAVVPQGKGLLVVVPDLVQGELRFVELGGR